jgi:hypothetical protein
MPVQLDDAPLRQDHDLNSLSFNYEIQHATHPVVVDDAAQAMRNCQDSALRKLSVHEILNQRQGFQSREARHVLADSHANQLVCRVIHTGSNEGSIS